ncbi:MAG: hypothetical protein M3O28_11450 [Actinomycetota bacterium]|nr:hypothetical protein [Actinomycetota bacterium]
MARNRIRRPLLALIVLVLLLAVGYAVRASRSHHSSHGAAPVSAVVHTLITGAPGRWSPALLRAGHRRPCAR